LFVFSLGSFERKYGGPDDHKLNIFFSTQIKCFDLGDFFYSQPLLQCVEKYFDNFMCGLLFGGCFVVS